MRRIKIKPSSAFGKETRLRQASQQLGFEQMRAYASLTSRMAVYLRTFWLAPEYLASRFHRSWCCHGARQLSFILH